MFAQEYVSGHFDMNEWAKPNIVTNYTAGFFVLFFLVGLTSGEIADVLMRVFKAKWSKATKFIVVVSSGFVGSLIYAQIVAATGLIEGSRF